MSDTGSSGDTQDSGASGYDPDQPGVLGNLVMPWGDDGADTVDATGGPAAPAPTILGGAFNPAP